MHATLLQNYHHNRQISHSQKPQQSTQGSTKSSFLIDDILGTKSSINKTKEKLLTRPSPNFTPSSHSLPLSVGRCSPPVFDQALSSPYVPTYLSNQHFSHHQQFQQHPHHQPGHLLSNIAHLSYRNDVSPTLPTVYTNSGFYSSVDSNRPWFWGSYFQRASHKRKGGQVRFTNEQTIQLERKFNSQKYLSPAERKKIAKTLHLTERQVKTWFQNRRAKWRRLKQDDEISPSKEECLQSEKTSSDDEMDGTDEEDRNVDEDEIDVGTP